MRITGASTSTSGLPVATRDVVAVRPRLERPDHERRRERVATDACVGRVPGVELDERRARPANSLADLLERPAHRLRQPGRRDRLDGRGVDEHALVVRRRDERFVDQCDVRDEVAHRQAVLGRDREVGVVERVEQHLEAGRFAAQRVDRRQRFDRERGGEQPVAQADRRVQCAGRAQPGSDVAEALGLGGRVAVSGDERVHRGGLVGFERIERVRADEILELAARHVHARSTPCASSAWAMRPSPRRIRDLAVPSGIPNSCATCR